MSFDPLDHRYGCSDCCGAPILTGDMCSECGEHCEDGQEAESEETAAAHHQTAT